MINRIYQTAITPKLQELNPHTPILIIQQTTKGAYTFKIDYAGIYDIGLASGGASGGGQKSGSTSKGTGGASGVALRGKIKLPVGDYEVVIGKGGSAYLSGDGQAGGDSYISFIKDGVKTEFLRLKNSSKQKGAAGGNSSYGNNSEYQVVDNIASLGIELIDPKYTFDNYHSNIYSSSPDWGGNSQPISNDVSVAAGGNGFVYSDKTPATDGEAGGIYLFG